MNIAPENEQELIAKCLTLEDTELKRHNDASHPLNVLLFLVDNGIIGNSKLQLLNNHIMKNEFCVKMNIQKAYGGSGEPVNTWMICDLPLTVYISIKLNNSNISKIHKEFIELIIRNDENNGWHCTNKGNIGKFRGPGRKDDECPLATLNVLKLLTLTKETEYLTEKEHGINALLKLWNDQKDRKEYLFGMGTDFRKLKYPMIWFDILNVVNVLSHYKMAISTREFKEMYEIILEKKKDNNYVPESVYQYWKNYDFGQKKGKSDYINKVMKEIDNRIRLTIASTMTTRPDTQSAS